MVFSVNSEDISLDINSDMIPRDSISSSSSSSFSTSTNVSASEGQQRPLSRASSNSETSFGTLNSFTASKPGTLNSLAASKPDPSLKFTLKKPKSLEDVQETMAEMDRINKTTFADWIRSESNISYLCSFKGPMILEYIEQDPESAMYALEWIIEGWAIDSVAELVLKLFYSLRIQSQQFSQRLYRLVHSWKNEKIVELLPILLIGEGVTTCSTFFCSWYQCSGYSSEKMADLVVPIAYGFKWSAEQLSEFLMETTLQICQDTVMQRSLIVVIHDEMEVAQNKILLNQLDDAVGVFEMLYQIILEEQRSFSSGNHKYLSQPIIRQKDECLLDEDDEGDYFVFDSEP